MIEIRFLGVVQRGLVPTRPHLGSDLLLLGLPRRGHTMEAISQVERLTVAEQNHRREFRVHLHRQGILRNALLVQTGHAHLDALVEDDVLEGN